MVAFSFQNSSKIYYDFELTILGYTMRLALSLYNT